MSNIERYAEIKKTIKALEEEAKQLNPLVLEEMMASSIKTAKTEFGTFSVVERKMYTYSPVVAQLENKLREAMQPYEEEMERIADPIKTRIDTQKQLEEMSGKAKLEVSKSLRFTNEDNTK